MKPNNISTVKRIISISISFTIAICLSACQNSVSADRQDHQSEIAETECQHDYIERDGRVVCTKCKDVCVHSYVNQNGGTFCDNCLFACKHPTFSDSNGNMICDNCGTVCTHSFAEGKCKVCGYICMHEYKMENEKIKCSICLLECPHNEFIDTDSGKLCIHCSFPCVHSYLDGLCQICKYVCIHEYTQQGSVVECSLCGNKKLLLTSDYLDISLEVIDVQIDDNRHIKMGMWGEATVEVKICRKKNVEFENASVSFDLESNWGPIVSSYFIDLPFDGNITKKITASAWGKEWLDPNPTFKIKSLITGGLIIEKE